VKVIHVVENFDDSYGGPAQTIAYNCMHLDQFNCESEVHSLRWHKNEINSLTKLYNISWTSYPMRFSKKISYSHKLSNGIEKSIEKSIDEKNIIIHTNNQWNYPIYCASKIKQKYDINIVCSLHGAISAYALSQKGKVKNIAWKLFQKKIFQQADCVHATNESELERFKKLIPKTNCALISNGIDFTEFSNMPSRKESLKKLHYSEKREYILFLSRVDKIKGLDVLIKSFAKIKNKLQNVDILIGGPIHDQAYFHYISKLITKHKIFDRVFFTGMLTGEKRINAYAAAKLFILPSYSENFGIVVAEALAAGIPVITTTGTPWSELEEYNCGWWIDLSVENLKNSILAAFELSEAKREEMGRNGKKLIKEKYGWEDKVSKMRQVYDWLAKKTRKPDFVY
jgi:glycosyltransferase involved in cell wall biosynthesis